MARSQSGFTYLGLMIFIAILALASVATLSAGTAMQRRMNEEELLFVGTQFAAAFKSYFEATPAGQRNYPAKLEDLLRDPRYPGIRRHLRRIYADPITGKAQWGLVAAPGGVIGVHSLSRDAPLKTAQFEAELAQFADKTSYAEWAFGFLPPGVVPSGNAALAATLATVPTPAGKPGVSPSFTRPGTGEPSTKPATQAPTITLPPRSD